MSTTCHIFISLICSCESKFKWFPSYLLPTQFFFPRDSLFAQRVKSPPAVQETQEKWVRSLVWGTPLRSKQQTAPAPLPGASRGHGSLGGHGPEGRRGSSLRDRARAAPCHSALEKLLSHSHLYVFSTSCNPKRQTLCNMLFIFLLVTVPVICCSETNDSKA